MPFIVFSPVFGKLTPRYQPLRGLGILPVLGGLQIFKSAGTITRRADKVNRKRLCENFGASSVH